MTDKQLGDILISAGLLADLAYVVRRADRAQLIADLRCHAGDLVALLRDAGLLDEAITETPRPD